MIKNAKHKIKEIIKATIWLLVNELIKRPKAIYDIPKSKAPKYPVITTPQSKFPNKLKEKVNGKVVAKAIAKKTKLPKAFAITASTIETEDVRSVSIVPWRYSSDHRRIVKAGIRNKKIQGKISKKPRISTWPTIKNDRKNNQEEKDKKTTKKI